MGSSGPAYPLSSTPATSSVSSGGGKTTALQSSKCPEEEEVAKVPNLKTISLPISALPTLSFTSLFPRLTTISTTPNVTPVTPVKEVLTNKAGLIFSAPVAKLGPSMSNMKLATPIAAAAKPVANKSTEDFEGPFKPAESLLDILKGPGLASPVAQNSPGPDNAPQQTSTQSTAPSSSTTTTATSSLSSSGFGNLFKAPQGWSCDVCRVQNKPSDTKCFCCMTPQPNSSASKAMDNKLSHTTSAGPESSIMTTSTTTTTTGFGNIFSKPAVGNWDCDTCLSINKADAVKCVACETAKPGTGLKPSLTPPSAFSAVKTVFTPTAPVSTGFMAVETPEGAWKCDICMVENKAEDTKCVACTSAKPGASAGASAGASSSASNAPVFGLGDAFKKPEGTWDCDVCLVPNKPADVRCAACHTIKSGASVKPKAFGSSAGGTSCSSEFGSSKASSGGFKFGTSDSTSGSGSGGFKFGGSSSKASSSSSGGFKFGVHFGSPSSETTSKDTTASSGFRFGSFHFGVASCDDIKSDQPAAGSVFRSGTRGGTGPLKKESNSAKGGFTFGLSKPKQKT